MKALLDTSVLVATFYADHSHHSPSADLFFRFGKNESCCAAPSLAEVYATLTKMPAPRRVSGDQALLFVTDIRAHLSIVALDAHEYYQVLESSGALGLAGGAIYDAVIGHCALKADAEAVYTWNTKDFFAAARSHLPARKEASLRRLTGCRVWSTLGSRSENHRCSGFEAFGESFHF